MTMNNIPKYQGLSQFGSTYKVMLENDARASGSVDLILVENMILQSSETINFLYSEYTSTRSFYEKGTRPELEQYVERAILGNHSDEGHLPLSFNIFI